MMSEKCCGKCKYNKRDWTNPNNPDFYCSNEDSWSYGYNTEYMHSCEDFEVVGVWNGDVEVIGNVHDNPELLQN